LKEKYVRRKKALRNVLFVCVENACRSQMAEAFFNKMSRVAKAGSAGTKPAMAVNLKRRAGRDLKPERHALHPMRAHGLRSKGI
jgi:protein-tyrosine-phosphatase